MAEEEKGIVIALVNESIKVKVIRGGLKEMDTLADYLGNDSKVQFRVEKP